MDEIDTDLQLYILCSWKIFSGYSEVVDQSCLYEWACEENGGTAEVGLSIFLWTTFSLLSNLTKLDMISTAMESFRKMNEFDFISSSINEKVDSDRGQV